MNRIFKWLVATLWLAAVLLTLWLTALIAYNFWTTRTPKDLDVAGYAALLAVIFALPKVRDFFEEKRDQRAAAALVKARNFAKALRYLTSPFVDAPNDENDSSASDDRAAAYRKLLYRDRNFKQERIKEEHDDFESVRKECDLYLSMNELGVIDELSDLEIEASVGFRLFASMAGSPDIGEQSTKWWQQAFLQGPYKPKLDSVIGRLTDMIRLHNDRYRLSR